MRLALPPNDLCAQCIAHSLNSVSAPPMKLKITVKSTLSKSPGLHQSDKPALAIENYLSWIKKPNSALPNT